MVSGWEVLPKAVSALRNRALDMNVLMSLAVIGGVLTSTVLTLIVVPVVYTWMDKLTRKGRSAATVDVFAEKLKAQAEASIEVPVASATTPALRREA